MMCDVEDIAKPFVLKEIVSEKDVIIVPLIYSLRVPPFPPSPPVEGGEIK